MTKMSCPFRIKEHRLPGAHIREYARATSLSQEEVLYISVKQYTPKDNPDPQKGDITIIGGHANGFPKELYEPLWEDIYHELKRQNINIRDIYILDAAWQGESGLVNASKVGNDPSWFDHVRDTLMVINTLRPPRPIIGIAHSFGGNVVVNAALIHPRLFQSLILLDPHITRDTAIVPGSKFNPVTASARRRDVWPSRAIAAEKFLKVPFYSAWDRRVFDCWVQHGLRDLQPDERPTETPDGPERVTLKTTKHQEIFTFARPSYRAFDESGTRIVKPELVPDIDPEFDERHPTYPIYRPESAATFQRLPHLRPSVLYIFGGASYISYPQSREDKLRLTGAGIGGSGGAAKGMVKEEVMDGVGHLIPMDDPKGCAKRIGPWVSETMEKWWIEQKEFEAWAAKGKAEKTELTQELNAVLANLDKLPKSERNVKL